MTWNEYLERVKALHLERVRVGEWWRVNSGLCETLEHPDLRIKDHRIRLEDCIEDAIGWGIWLHCTVGQQFTIQYSRKRVLGRRAVFFYKGRKVSRRYVAASRLAMRLQWLENQKD